MNHTLTIARRELASLFFSPIAYVVLGVFALVATLIFAGTFGPGEPATLRSEFSWLVWLMVFLVPALSMRLLSDELRNGTLELLMTSPLNDVSVVVGKWLGAMGFLVVLLLVPLVAHLIVLQLNASPDYGPVFSGILGLILVGGLYLAIGTLASALTDTQIIAFLVTVLATGFLTIGLYMLAPAQWVPPWLRSTMYYLNVDRQFADFGKGIIDLSGFVYFFSGIALFLFLAMLTLQSRRWR